MLTKNIEKQENNTKIYPINVGARLKEIPGRHDTTVPTKNRHGITLIALVITIIILLILAGIVLNLSIGENGIITKAQQAGKNYDEAGAREKLELALLDLQADKVVNSAYNDSTYIDNYLTKKQMTVNGNIVTVGKYQFEIDRSVPKIASSLGKEDEIITEQKANLTAGNTVDGQVMLKIEVALPNDTIQGIEIYDETNSKIETINVPAGTKQIQKEQEIYVEFMEEKTYYAKIIGENSNIQTNTVNVQKNENAITSASDLKKLATLVNNGEKTFEGETITQVEDIDLNAVCGSGIGNWEPIGYNGYWFNGTYDGNGKEITNLYMNVTEKATGLFGFLGYKGTVKNIIVHGELTETGYNGAVAGIVVRNEGIVDGCINNVTVSGINSTGGIVGVNFNTIKNCINNGKIIGKEDGTGGIAGRDRNLSETLKSDLSTVNPVIENCKNSSDAIIQGTVSVGGICGIQNISKIDNCTNGGTIMVTSSIVGGIAGDSSADITNCKNTGTVVSNGNPSDPLTTQGTGGIVGRTTANVGFSSNEGDITSKGYYVGGIVGIGGENTSVGQCYNKGSIEAEQNAAGGIVGLRAGVGIYNCYNYLSADKKIKGNYNVGGIMGNTNSTTTIWSCYSIGENIIGNSNAAILGAYQVSGTSIDKCYYVSGSSLNGIGTERVGDLATNNITAKDLNDFKLEASNTNSVVYMLESNNPGLWAQSNDINDGLPYLVNNNR